MTRDQLIEQYRRDAQEARESAKRILELMGNDAATLQVVGSMLESADKLEATAKEIESLPASFKLVDYGDE